MILKYLAWSMILFLTAYGIRAAVDVITGPAGKLALRGCLVAWGWIGRRALPWTVRALSGLWRASRPVVRDAWRAAIGVGKLEEIRKGMR